ncbi:MULTISPECIES: hypothetical protein [unclassified Pseudomonas]|uniref:hypothetical protein n=1 Tax=unclassified Pseudomonas TaxID=196821 RepID=UPI000270BBD0|nr:MULTISPECIES: hypothetical protein [unclassified Pseudomonas]EJM92413.1 hypothetical protein PMI33_00670 [Pseudomonas sp. GM67]
MAGLTKEQKAARVLLAKAIEISTLSADEFEKLSDDEKKVFLDMAQDASEPEDEVDNSHLIEVSKDGETLSVHPTALADHKRNGWKEV